MATDEARRTELRVMASVLTAMATYERAVMSRPEAEVDEDLEAGTAPKVDAMEGLLTYVHTGRALSGVSMVSVTELETLAAMLLARSTHELAMRERYGQNGSRVVRERLAVAATSADWHCRELVLVLPKSVDMGRG